MTAYAGSEAVLARYLKAGLDKIDQGVTIFDAELNLVFANHTVFDLLDVPERLMQPGTTFEEIIRYNVERGEYGEGDIEEMVVERVEQARRFEAHAIERKRPNGMILRISGWPIVGGGFATIYTDVTQQRAREAELERQVMERTEELRRNEARLRLIANEVPAGIAYLSREEEFHFVNTRFAKAYDLDVDGIVGMKASDVLSPELMKVAHPHFELAKQGEAVVFDHEAVLADGRRLDVRSFLRPESDTTRSSRGFYVLSIYIGRQKRAEAALLQAKKMQALDQLSSGIAHDFNNLLTVIIGNLTPLAAEIGDDAARETMLAPALRAARRGADLTSRLLATARRQPLSPRATNISEATRALAKLAKPSIPDGVEITLNIASDHIVSYVDRAFLDNALLNLVINARDAVSGCGKIALSVRRRLVSPSRGDIIGVEPGSYVEIACSDNGVGINPTELDRVFEPFFSTKSDSGGSGLGLAMVYAFARESGGGVTVQSAPGEGAKVTLYLPALDLEDGAPASDAPSNIVDERLKAVFEGVLLLLVDDDDEVRAVMRRELVGLGFLVVEASNGREAIELAKALPEVRLVLSDIAMPGGMSGTDLALALSTERPELAIVLMTGHGVERYEGELGALSPEVLRKPIEPDSLARALAQALMRAPTQK